MMRAIKRHKQKYVYTFGMVLDSPTRLIKTKRLAEFAQLNFFLNQMQRLIEDRIEDACNGKDASDNGAYIGGQMT